MRISQIHARATIRSCITDEFPRSTLETAHMPPHDRVNWNMCSLPHDDSPVWIAPLCRIPQEWKLGDGAVRLREHFERASPDLSNVDRAKALIRHHLADEPALAEAWQTYSYDKRTKPRAYLDDCEVGYFDGKRHDFVRYDSRLDACADYIVREARSVLANV